MTPQQLAQFSREQLGKEAERSGGILYSKPDTLSSDDVYVMGYNPGGDSGPAINDELNRNFARNQHALNQTWQHRDGLNSGGTIRNKDVKNATKYQKGVKQLIALLGKSEEDVLLTNLIFFQSHNDEGVNYTKDSNLCWPIHEKMMAIVKPKLIVTVGNGASKSAYAKLRQLKYAKNSSLPELSEPANHGNYRLKGFRFFDNGQNITVVGLPHFSYYNVAPNKALLCDFINKLAKL